MSVDMFSQVAKIDAPRNVFDEPYNFKCTLNQGELIPCFWAEVVPGDTFKLNSTFFGRLSTPFVPVLDNIYLDYHLFYVPFRILWDNYRKFTGEKVNPDDSTQYIMPYISSGESGFDYDSLFDYLGMPVKIANMRVDSGLMYCRAYNAIFNQWYRCEYLQDSVVERKTDSGDLIADFNILKRNKSSDYITNCLPTPQRGPAVTVPLGTSAPVIGNGIGIGLTDGTSNVALRVNAGSTLLNCNGVAGDTIGSSTSGSALSQGKVAGLTEDPDKSGLIADLSSVSTVTINALRTLVTTQQYYELLNRYGTRYREQQYALFGVTVNDVSYIPEYLGGHSCMINIAPVPQTSSTDTTSPQGNLSAYATLQSTGNGFVRSFQEAGVILGICSVRTDLNYQQNLDRHFSRSTYEDFMKPVFAHIGDQPVYNKELIALGTDRDNEVFGYNERYAEYRSRLNIITGRFRSQHPQSLDIWHLAEYFDPTNPPTLSGDFIKVPDTIQRITAVQDEPELLLDVHHDLTIIRELPLYGIPGLKRL